MTQPFLAWKVLRPANVARAVLSAYSSASRLLGAMCASPSTSVLHICVDVDVYTGYTR